MFGKTQHRIVKVTTLSDCICFHLDKKWVDKNGVNLFINCGDYYPFYAWQVGDIIEIDQDKTETMSWLKYHIFNDLSIVRKVNSSEVVSSSSSAVVPRSNNNLTSISQSQASGAIQMLNRAIDSDPRNKYTASMEVDPKTGNVFYHLSGERK